MGGRQLPCGRCRKGEAEATPFANLALDPDSTAVCFDDPFCYRKTEPHTSTVRLARLPEALEQMGEILGWNPGSGVGHLEDDFVILPPSAQRDASSFRRELDGIRQEIAEHLAHAFAVGAHVERLVRILHDEVDRFVGGKVPDAIRGRREQMVRRDLLALERKVTGFYSNDVEEIADEPLHLPNGAIGGVEHLLAIGRRQVELADHLHRRHDDAERVAQVMRDDPEYLRARLSHSFGLEPPVALAFQRARASQRAANRLREQSRERLVGGSERRRSGESHQQAANQLIAIDQW